MIKYYTEVFIYLIVFIVIMNFELMPFVFVLAIMAFYDRQYKLVPDLGLAVMWALVALFGNTYYAVVALACIYLFSIMAMKIENKPGVSIGDILGAPALFAFLPFNFAFMGFATPILISAITKKESSCFEYYFIAALAALVASFI